MKKLVVLLVVGFLASTSYGVIGDTWDLSADWSDLVNPNDPNNGGIWTVADAGGAAMDQNVPYNDGGHFAADETIWNSSVGPAHVGAMKMNVDGVTANPGDAWSYLAGDIVGHTTHGIRWKAPETGKYAITGMVWRARNSDANLTANLWSNSTGGWVNLTGIAIPFDIFRNVAIPYSYVLDFDAGEEFVVNMDGNDYGAQLLTIEQISDQSVNLTIIANPAQVDTVVPNTGVLLVSLGQAQILNAATFINCANNGEVLVFDSWTVDVGAGTETVADPGSAITTIVMDSDKTVTANYVDGRQCGDECHPIPTFDFNLDCIVDEGDFAQFAAGWMECSQPACD